MRRHPPSFRRNAGIALVGTILLGLPVGPAVAQEDAGPGTTRGWLQDESANGAGMWFGGHDQPTGRPDRTAPAPVGAAGSPDADAANDGFSRSDGQGFARPGDAISGVAAESGAAATAAAGPTLTVPDAAVIGAEIEATWSGFVPTAATLILVPADLPPDETPDPAAALSRAPAAGADGQARLTLPVAPGAYELRLVEGAEGRVLARAPITVTWAEVSLTAPERVDAGSGLEVSWTPTVNPSDRLLLVPAEAPAEADTAPDQTSEAGAGPPARLLAPAEAGAYELRYVIGQGPRRAVVARRPVTVTAPVAHKPPPEPPVEAAPAPAAEPKRTEAPTVALELSAEAAPNEQVSVRWQGPDRPHDRIALARPAQSDVSWLWSVLTGAGNPATLRMPEEPGQFEVRYVDVAHRRVLARQSIAVVAPPAAAPTKPLPAERPPSEAEALAATLNGIAAQGTCACTCETFETLTRTLDRQTQAGIALLHQDPAASGALRAAITGAQDRAAACIRRCQATFLTCE